MVVIALQKINIGEACLEFKGDLRVQQKGEKIMNP